MTIFIPGDVPSSKNSKRIVRGGLINSKAVMKYKKERRNYYLLYKNQFRQLCKNGKPIKVNMLFARKTLAKYDHHNMIQLVADLMVEYGWIEDDNIDNLLIYPPFEEPYSIHDKTNPGVYITVL